ncbi:MAG: LON peptidase substrate-binding domain-containing protein, partial [Microgenomates group bacterium]
MTTDSSGETKLTAAEGINVPLVALRDVVIFPYTEIPLTFGRAKSNAAVSTAFKSDKKICFVCQKNPRVEMPNKEDLYSIGTLAEVEHLIENDGNIHALIQGLKRVKILQIAQTDPYFIATVIDDEEVIEETDELRALEKHVIEQVQRIFNLGKSIDVMILMKLLSGVTPAELANQVSSILDLKPVDRQMLLEMSSINERLE